MNRHRRQQRAQRLPGHGLHRHRNGDELTVARLQELLTEDPNTITFSLSSSQSSLEKLLNQPFDYGFAELFVKVLKKSMKSVSLTEKNNEILSLLLHTKFPLYISQLIAGINLSSEGLVEFLKNIVYILKAILSHNPSEYMNTLQIIGAMSVILNEFSDRTDDNLQRNYKELQDLLQVLMKKERKQETENVLSSTELPPDDFRDVPLMPAAQEIHSKEKIFLRKNKVKGSYDNVDHYLDVQFRLMREDFFSPLRSGIQQYLALKNEQKRKRIDDLCIYNQVHILYSVCTLEGIAYKVSFDTPYQRINWEQSKRLLYGSLVCLTSDNFQTIYFATVVDRKTSELKEGLINLLFLSNCEDISRLSSTTAFIMAETTAYFEAYRHILIALKQITNDNMPFQDYIINGSSNVKAPKYLIQQSQVKMELACLNEDCKLQYSSVQNVVKIKEKLTKSLTVDILHDSWPCAEALKLNDSQHQALQNALTKEFSLTQGPPGTGKTYIGLKIVKALCCNSHIWQANRKSPMLIVCYTNQALDKFLEGIASFMENGILRVGGRSNSEVLNNYLLNNIRKNYRINKSFSSEFIRNKHAAISELKNVKLQIEEIMNQIKVTKNGILHEDILEEHMGHFYEWLRDSFQDNYVSQTNRKISLMTEWLGYGNIEVLEIDPDNEDVEADDDLHEGLVDEDEVQVYTEIDFIQQHRMVANDRLDEEIFIKDDDDEVLALKLSDLDRRKKINQDGFQKTKQDIKKQKQQLKRNLNSNILLTDEEVDQIHYHDLWLMKKEKRWKLYHFWVASYCQQLRDKIVQKEIQYNIASQAFKELQRYEDGEIMKNSLIIGMTTTAAARYHTLLQEIQPKIIIVEEAAEILEAHIVTSLNPMCEQLILIGDHKQLRPNPNVYELARNYNLEISLFERMVLNECQVKSLSYQHRMRPEISQLLHTIYPDLQDHSSVKSYEDIKGLKTNIYFIQHNNPERTNAESISYSNPHEAYFIVELCKYLLKQGYNKSQITVLTTYTTQLFMLKDLMKNTIFKGVKLTVIDNYQGEENDIILLSLVRNNEDRKIGFLKSDNRVCVALSRAKIGFYVIGNFEIFSEQSKLWNSILLMLKSQELVGHALTLCCANHPNRNVQVRSYSDFAQAPEGGCLKPCESRLKCGHTCKRLCHPVDDHDEYECVEKCTRTAPNCPDNHECVHVCSEKCTPCMKMLPKIIPNCNHQQMMACSENPNLFKCKKACEKLLPCGHQCMELCSDFCTYECIVSVSKSYPCGHTVKLPCYLQSSVCPEACRKRLDCGHQCSGTCGECSERQIHSLCSEGCRRQLVCGHQCQNKQCNVCSPCLKPCQNRCIHSKCMDLCGKLCTPCKEPCEWRCDHYQCNRYCHESCDRPKCDEACLKHLPCGHLCVGLCGEKCPHLCRVCNKEELTEIFFGTEDEKDVHFVELEDCGHIFEKSGLDEWMSQETAGEIQLKFCPKCKVPIRRNLRYGQIINKTLMDIDMVKSKMIGDRQKINELIREIKSDLYKVPKDYRSQLQYECCRSQNSLTTLYYWHSFSQRIKFLLFLFDLMTEDILKEDSSLQKHFGDLSQWFLNHKNPFSETELTEIETEMERIRKIHKFYKVKIKFMHELNIKHLIEQGLQMLKTEDYSKVKDKISEIEKDLSKLIPIISEKEKIDIVKAIGLAPGHWFKCPNGHIYVIGECGGAMQHSTCPECGLPIGGMNHALESGNTLASEMDGAQYAAWSDQANMENYVFEDI